MSTIALIDRDLTPMSGESDPNTLTGLVGVGSGILGAIAGFFFKSGALRAEVTALALRVTALEASNGDLREKLEQTATKEDVRYGFTDMKQQVRDAEIKQQARDAEITREVRELTAAVYKKLPPSQP
jgi:hypothetical protein